MVTWRRYTIALLQRSPIDGVLYNAVVAHRYSRVSFSVWVAGARKARAPRPGDARLSAVRPSIFLRRCRLSLSLSLSVFREETTLPARPQEHMFTNNKSRRMLLKNQQTERITPPRFDRHSLNWFILSCCPTDAIRFLFSVSSGCRTVEGCLVTVYIVCPRLNNFIPLYKWGIKSNDI